ncbi:MAG: hypothetical protein IJP96_05840 [Synergistaceae bacterium]|nr:hypothetical protein [Synergistaceae bacterium]MBQ6434559.1 hypothetical protein [Synergistaceae bacterium]MBQ6738101.1 hypothetical protein [Synergistaceae bacterium]MBR0075255.1 hypothetical protein [Synergistaceae bacterium]MBR0078781.1 hypothetical protein [Synergistaceae bacterium]
MAKGIYTNKAAQSVAEFRHEVEVLPSAPKKNKSGRPTKGKVHKISLAIPVELYEGVEFASYFFRGNITAYINNLIRRDLEKNFEKYREFKAMMDEMNRTL